MLTIDGSQGEGGGQILRTSLALSLVTGQPFRIINIRAGRKKPGLLRQHLTAVQAAVEVGRAEARGAALGSLELEFSPAGVFPGQYHFEVGSAGSTTLVLQTILPPLLIAAGPSRLFLSGGTHNPFAPPFDFLEHTFLPLIRQMGPRVEATLERPGFYPVGGGRMSVIIEPAGSLRQVVLLERGPVQSVWARAVIANLPRHIAERELAVVHERLGWPPARLEVREAPEARGPGNVLLLAVQTPSLTEIFAAFGQRGVRAEEVAGQAVAAVSRYLEADVPVGEHLADQLLLPMALAGGGSFRTLPLSPHARTNLGVLQIFLDCAAELVPQGEDACLVRVRAPGPWCSASHKP